MKSQKVKIFSFFSGAGFLDLGFEKAGFEIAFVNELSESFMNAYQFSRECMRMESPEYGYDLKSMTNFFNSKNRLRLKDLVVKASRTSDLVGFIGGPPCPDFSLGGLNQGRTGSSGKLSLAYVNLILDHQPDFFVFENVKGLYQTKKHRRYFEFLKKKLRDGGYATDEQLLNSLEYGVPQHRERVILVGFHKRLMRDLKLESSGHFLDWKRYKRHSLGEIANCSWPDTNPFRMNSKISCPKDIIRSLTVEDWFQRNQVLEHLNSEHRFTPKAKARFTGRDEGDMAGKSFKRLHRWRYSPAACYGNNEVHLHPYEARRISVAEALAIQSMPRGFVLPPDMPISHMFKVVGNGVPYLASKGIANTIKDALI